MWSSHPGLAPVALPGGAGTIRIAHNKTGFVWIIHQIAIATVPAGPLNVQSFFNDQPLMDPIAVLSGAAADGEPPIILGDHDILRFLITKATIGSNAILAYYYEEVAL